MSEIRKLTDAEIADQQRDAVRIAPGIWRDRDGHVHWSIPELLAAFGLEDTPEDRAAVLRILQTMSEEAGAEVIVQETADPYRPVSTRIEADDQEDLGGEEPEGFLG